MTVSKKNIIIIGPAHPLRGGLASYNERLARAFLEDGHSVSIHTFSLQYPGFLFPGTSQYSAEPPPPGVYIHVGINSVNPFNWLVVGKRLRQAQPDLVIVRYWLPFMAPCLGTILRSIKKNKHTKIICIADNIIPHETRPGDALLTKYFIRPVDAFITMSEKVLADLRIYTQKPALHIPHPLYDNFGPIISRKEAREKLEIGENEKIILFFGFIRKYKGLDILLDAWKILQEKESGFKLLIAGEFYGDRKMYDEQISRLGISGGLIMKTSFIADSDVKYYFCGADLVVQPYRNATQSGVTPLAYHFETPMVVTNVGGLPNMVPDNKAGLIAEPNPQSLADKITEYFIKGPAHFLPGLRDEKKKYSWQVITDAIISLM